MNLLFSCIGRRGYIADWFREVLEPTDRIVGTSNTRWTPGFQACDAAFVLPDVSEPGYVPAVLDLCVTQQIDAVLSFHDLDVQRLAQARAEFRRLGVVPLLPSVEVAEITNDKYQAFLFLSARGIPTPRTALTPDEASAFGYPMYVKPRRGSASADTFLVRNEKELRFFFEYRPDMIIQEAIHGEELGAALCGDLDGVPVGLCTWRKYAMRQGETDKAETLREPSVTDLALRFAQTLQATGPLDIDILRRGEALFVLEANTRFGGGHPLARLAGATFPRLLVELVRRGRVDPDFSFVPGVVMMKRIEPFGGSLDAFFRDDLRVYDEGGSDVTAPTKALSRGAV